MSTAELTLTNSYWALLRHLSDDVKLRLAGMLTNSVVDNHEKTVKREENITKQMIAKYAGALDDDRPADEIIDSIKQTRTSKTIQEFSL